jgi:hypothetical protein
MIFLPLGVIGINIKHCVKIRQFMIANAFRKITIFVK